MESYRAQQAINMGITNNTGIIGGKNQQANLNGDFFAAFLQLITQGNSKGQTDILSGLNGQDGQVNEEIMNILNSSDEPSEEVNANAMEMMAALMNSGGSGYNLLLNNNIKDVIGGLVSSGDKQPIDGTLSTENGIATANLTNANFLREMLLSQAQKGDGSLSQISDQINLLIGSPSTQGQVNPLLQSQMQAVMQNEQPSDKNVKITANNVQGAASNGKEQQSVIPNMGNTIPVTATNESKNSSDTLFNGDMNFKNSVAQAQKLLKSQAKEVPEKDINSENAFQTSSTNQAKLEGILPDKPTVLPKPEVDLEDLSSQIKNNLANGGVFDKKEFSVKLRPEGLGEVTIKLISEHNKVTMSIVTATTEAAKALNDQLPTLRETMRAMQVDVKDVVANNAQDSFNDLQQSLQHQNSNQQNQFTDNRHGRNSNSFTKLVESEPSEEANRLIMQGERKYMYI